MKISPGAELRRFAGGRVVRGAYLARFNTTSAKPPLDPAFVHFSSSPVRVKGRFCSIPFRFGYELISIWKVMVLSSPLTVYQPK